VIDEEGDTFVDCKADEEYVKTNRKTTENKDDADDSFHSINDNEDD
jgi:hypothetical protein